MSQKNLSRVATDVIATYGITATNVINTYRFGGERVAGYVNERFAVAVNRGGAALRKDLRSNLIDSQQRVSSYYVKGIHFGTDKAENVVGMAVDLATRSVGLLALNAERIAERIDRATNLNALERLNSVVMPAAHLVVKVADRIEEGSSELVRRVSGKDMPAKALATIKLKAATSKASATRKRVTKAATRKASTIVAETATDTSNAARRVSRKIKAAGDQVVKTVTSTATETSNIARRVARKAKATAKAA